MSKAVLISIRPEWCAKIANGKKTIEVRKTRPKLETPFKCYIYCTKPSRSKMWRAGEYMCFNDDELYRDEKGKIKYGCSIELMACDDFTEDNFLNGKVIGEFVCDEIERYAQYGYCGAFPEYMKSSPGGFPATEIHYFSLQLSPEELREYGKGRPLFGWHIFDLEIYEEPRRLGTFRLLNPRHDFSAPGEVCLTRSIARAPQSWCYVEELP